MQMTNLDKENATPNESVAALFSGCQSEKKNLGNYAEVFGRGGS